MGKTDSLIKSVSHSQTEILRNILTLHVHGGKIDCDPTYSTGGFYRDGVIPPPRLRFDIEPQAEGVVRADCRNLPLESDSLNCVAFDPPFLATKGKSLDSGTGNRINRRFGVFPSEPELHRFYADSLKELYRILTPHGILIFKCQDKVSGGKQYMSHVFIINEAVRIGFYPRDLFVLLAKNRLVADWQIRNQRTARKYHCYFVVLEKDGPVVRYL
ncbi:MAG: hypothetical protein IJT94_02920 [Oscillibacter sp.]|nr:hypothetical protein [Oscillibacter sp.]